MSKTNVLFIDNFDSFTYNLVDEFEKRNCNVLVFRNNTSFENIKEIVKNENINLIVISPGGFVPSEVPICKDIILKYYKTIPILGICLGHQCIIEAFGGIIDRAPMPFHGKSSYIEHDKKTIFKNLQTPMLIGRYHSQMGFEIPDCLEISARTNEVIMAVRHKTFNVEGVQFHPESILTPQGGALINNMISMVTSK